MSDHAIDNTPLQMAKEEGEALEAARRAPLARSTANTFSSNLYEFAKRSGKLVFNSLEEVGISKEEVATIRERMAAWVNIVNTYAKDIHALRQMDIGEADRRQLLGQMLEARDEAREQLFG
jgi:hypothetical protein